MPNSGTEAKPIMRSKMSVFSAYYAENKFITVLLNTTKWAKIGTCSLDTALRDIQDVIGKGILTKTEQGGRSTNCVLKMSE